jgi:hypothetical protein
MARQHVTGSAGMYFAAYRLSQMGWNVMPTARNARGIDLLAYDATAIHYLGIQVKALSKTRIIVSKIATDAPECFIMTPEEVRRLPTVVKKRVGYRTGSNQINTRQMNSAKLGPGSGAATSAKSN